MLHNIPSSLSIITKEKFEAKLLNFDDIIKNFAKCHDDSDIINIKSTMYLYISMKNYKF